MLVKTFEFVSSANENITDSLREPQQFSLIETDRVTAKNSPKSKNCLMESGDGENLE